MMIKIQIFKLSMDAMKSNSRQLYELRHR